MVATDANVTDTKLLQIKLYTTLGVNINKTSDNVSMELETDRNLFSVSIGKSRLANKYKPQLQVLLAGTGGHLFRKTTLFSRCIYTMLYL